MERLRLGHWRSSQAFILITICTAIFVDAFIYGLVVPVIPFVLRNESRTDEQQLQVSTSLIIAGFGVMDFIGAPLTAWYIDRTTSRRVPFLFGLAMMVIGTILFGIPSATWSLFVSRVFQGFGSAILYTVGLAVLVDTVKHEEVSQWMGTAMSCNSVGMVFGPIVGGVVYDRSRRWGIFGIMVALVALDITLRLLMVMKDSGAMLAHGTPAKMGSTIVYSVNGAELSGTTLAVHSKKDLPLVKVTSVEATTEDLHDIPLKALPAIAHVKNDRSTRLPGIIRLIRSPRMLTALYGSFLNECLVTSLFAVLPLFVNQKFHWTSLEAGLVFLTIAIPSFGGFLAGRLSDKVGPRWVALGGLVLAAPFLILLRLVSYTKSKQAILMCGLLTGAGCAMTLFISPFGAEVSFVAEREAKRYSAESNDSINADLTFYAASFSLMNTALATSTLFGPLFTGWLSNSFGWNAVTLALGCLCLSAVVPTLLFTGGRDSGSDQAANSAPLPRHEVLSFMSRSSHPQLRKLAAVSPV